MVSTSWTQAHCPSLSGLEVKQALAFCLLVPAAACPTYRAPSRLQHTSFCAEHTHVFCHALVYDASMKCFEWRATNNMTAVLAGKQFVKAIALCCALCFLLSCKLCLDSSACSCCLSYSMQAPLPWCSHQWSCNSCHFLSMLCMFFCISSSHVHRLLSSAAGWLDTNTLLKTLVAISASFLPTVCCCRPLSGACASAQSS